MLLCGSYLYKPQAKGLAIAAGTAVVAALMFAAIEAGLIERRPFNAEVTAGIALGIPAVYVLTKLKFHRVDEFLGDISYGVFLNHFVVMYSCALSGPLPTTRTSLPPFWSCRSD